MSRLRLALCGALLLCALALPALCEPLPDGYRPIARNEDYALYVRDDTLSIIVERLDTGARLYSAVRDPERHKDNAAWKGFYQSGVVINYIEGVVTNQADFINCLSRVTMTDLPDGFHADAYFPDLGLGFALTVTLKDDGIHVFMPRDGLIEDDPAARCIADAFIYPFLGYSELGADAGYMLIPDGQGALIELKDNAGRFSSPYTATVYGRNLGLEELSQQVVYRDADTSQEAERVVMPVYGIAHTDDGLAFLAVIEEGDVSARVQAYPNGVRMKFDWVTFKYTWRLVYSQPTGPSSGAVPMLTGHAKRFDIRQRFLLTKGDQANYCGLAVAYRKYLQETGALKSADGARAFDAQIDFLGAEKKNWVLGTADVAMTTFAQAGDILTALRARGVDGVLSVYRGWQQNGLTGGLPVTGYAPSGALGGRGALEALYETCDALGARLYLEADLLSLNAQTHPLLLYSAFKKVTNATFTKPLYGKVYATGHYLSPEKTAELGKQLIGEMTKAGAPGVSLTGFTQFMTDYSAGGRYHDATETRALYEDLARGAQAALPTLLAGANAYLWPYADALIDVPVAGSDYQFVSRDVPFLSIALSGRMPVYAEYVNFQANTRRFFLRLVEQGARPSFLITHQDPIELADTNSSGVYSSRFDLYEDMIADWYLKLKALHAQTGGAGIVRHETQGDLTLVGYENGVLVLINDGRETISHEGVTVPPMGYEVVTGHE